MKKEGEEPAGRNAPINDKFNSLDPNPLQIVKLYGFGRAPCKPSRRE
jgi:hypothetical protein